MSLTEAQSRSRVNYAKRKLKRVPFDVQKEYYEEVLKPIADSVGEPVNTFIKKAIEERIARLAETPNDK